MWVGVTERERVPDMITYGDAGWSFGRGTMPASVTGQLKERSPITAKI